MENIISTIAEDSLAERINREMDMLGEIPNCKRNKNESMVEYASRFERAVARYLTHSGDNEGKYEKNIGVSS